MSDQVHGECVARKAGATAISRSTRVDGPLLLLTSTEVAELLRTTPKAIYVMVERGLLPGVTRIGRRVLVRRDDLLEWLDQKARVIAEE